MFQILPFLEYFDLFSLCDDRDRTYIGCKSILRVTNPYPGFSEKAGILN